MGESPLTHEEVAKFVAALARPGGFYGKVELTLEAGKFVMVRVTEHLMPAAVRARG